MSPKSYLAHPTEILDAIKPSKKRCHMTNNINNNPDLSGNEDDDEMPWAEEEDEMVWANEEEAPPIYSPDENPIAEQNSLLTEPKEWISHDATTWKVMVIDDEPEIHDVIRFALDGFIFQAKILNLIFASSGKQAKSLLQVHPDTALIFLDVVMEENDAGLQLVKYIRNTLQQHLVRIILHTGQPGEAPEELVIENYDINDYKLKSEMTQGKLLVATMAGLRSYRDLRRLEMNKIALSQTNGQLQEEMTERQKVQEKLTQSLQELSELYRTVEQKVEERTAQLAHANTQLADANQEITALNEQLKSENIRMSAELDISRCLQQMLLPKEDELQQIEDLDIACFMEPAEKVGGDYYDVLYHDGCVLIGIGDVTGHGLESGALAMMVQSAVRTLLASSHEIDTIKFLNALNQMVYHNAIRMNAEKSMTLALLSYKDGTLILSGQHEEMIIVRANGELEQIDTVDLGFPIGLEEDIADFVSQTSVSLKPGEVVVLYTDGITEAENVASKLYGLERLCEMVKHNWQQTAHHIRQAVIDDVRQFIGEQQVYDDITLLVLKQQ